jgi:hypothetical protein
MTHEICVASHLIEIMEGKKITQFDKHCQYAHWFDYLVTCGYFQVFSLDLTKLFSTGCEVELYLSFTCFKCSIWFKDTLVKCWNYFEWLYWRKNLYGSPWRSSWFFQFTFECGTKDLIFISFLKYLQELKLIQIFILPTKT